MSITWKIWVYITFKLLLWLQAVVVVQKSFIDSLPYNLESPREVLRSIISFNLELYEK